MQHGILANSATAQCEPLSTFFWRTSCTNPHYLSAATFVVFIPATLKLTEFRHGSALLQTVRQAPGPAIRDPTPASLIALEALEDRCVPAVLFVDPSNIAIKGTFTTIGAAVSAAHAGDTIKVVAGTYHEAVDVTKPGVTLLGGQVRIPGLEKPGPSIVTSNPGITGFTLDAGNVTVEGFTITDEANGVVTNGSFSGFRILNNTFLDDGAGGAGVHLNTALTAAATTTIQGNKFANDGNGFSHDAIQVVGTGAANVVISHNHFISDGDLDGSISVDGTSISTNLQILSNQFSNSGGMTLDNLANAKVDNNVILNPTSTAIALAGGVSGSQVANNTIGNTQTTTGADGIALNNDLIETPDSGNKIAGNTILRMNVGIALSPASQTTISGNVISYSIGDGMVIAAEITENTTIPSTGNTVSNNTVVASGGNGIHLSSANLNTLTRNVVNRNGASGLEIQAGQNSLTANTAEFNVASGIDVSGDHNVLTSNTTAFNTGSGVSVSGTFNALTSNVAAHNARIGFALNTASNNELTQNTARANLLDGFFVVGNSNTNSFDKNVAVNNGQDGFEIIGDLENASNVLTANTASNNGAAGISVADGSDNLIKGNTANDNGGTGIILLLSIGGGVAGNTADGNGSDGIHVENCRNCTVSSDTLLNNFGDGIDVDSGTSGNQITTNTATGNGVASGGFDLFDGAGSATQNTWTLNKAGTRNSLFLG